MNSFAWRPQGKSNKSPDGQWETTELGQKMALEEMKEDYGIWAPIVRLYDKLRAWWLRTMGF